MWWIVQPILLFIYLYIFLKYITIVNVRLFFFVCISDMRVEVMLESKNYSQMLRHGQWTLPCIKTSGITAITYMLDRTRFFFNLLCVFSCYNNWVWFMMQTSCCCQAWEWWSSVLHSSGWHHHRLPCGDCKHGWSGESPLWNKILPSSFKCLIV